MRRVLFMVAAMAPVFGLIGLLAWGVIQTGGRPGGIAVNAVGGEAEVRQRTAPKMELRLFQGGTLNLQQLRGQVVMVDFWASWCPPCRQEAPTLARVYQEYQGRGVEFVGVSLWDNEGDAMTYVRRYGISFPTGLDDRGAIAVPYGVRGIPEKYFIDRDGTIVRKFIGPTDEAKLRQALDELLAE